MKNNYYKAGQYNFICDSCGFKYKTGKAKKRWDGLYVCNKCFEHRHEQDFVKAKNDKITVPWSRPPADTFVTVTYASTGDTFCTPSGSQAIPGLAVPACAIPNKIITGL